MRKLIAAVSAVLILAGCGDDKKSGFELKGTLSDSKGEMVFLEKLTTPQPVLVDSVILDENGNFEFKNYVPKIGFYRIKTSPQNFAMLVLDSGDKVTVTGSIKDLGNTYKATGSKETNLFMEYSNLEKARTSQLDSLQNAFRAAMQTIKMDSLKMDSLSKVFQGPYEAIMAKHNKIVSEKLKANTDMYSSIMAIQGLEPEQYKDLYLALDKGLSAKYPNDKTVRTFHEVISKMISTIKGQQAPEINLPTPEGKELALSSLRGKVVLVDFWASWCGPCRREMPNVVKAYKKYKDKGFEIYGVSLDQDKEKWIEAIKSDGITWPQVSDLKYWQSEVVPLYSIQGIPYTVLLDKEGKIIAKGLRGPELESAIEKALAGEGS